MKEIFVDIKGFEGKYKISNTGKVMSINYNNTNKEKILSPRLNKRGIYTINLYKNNKAYNYSVALLVAKHFLKKENENDVVIHINDKTDDNVNNLRYVSQAEARYIERHKKHRNEIIDKLYTNGEIRKYKEIAKQNGISTHHLYRRLYDNWSIEDAITIPVERNEHILKKRLYKYQDKLYSVSQLVQISNGVTESALRKRIKRGWTIDEAINIPLNIYKKGGGKNV